MLVLYANMVQCLSAPAARFNFRAGSMLVKRCQPVKVVAKVLNFFFFCKSISPCLLIDNGLPVCNSRPYSHLLNARIYNVLSHCVSTLYDSRMPTSQGK